MKTNKIKEEEQLKRIAKQIDPDNTFLKECDKIIHTQFNVIDEDNIV